MKKEKKEKPTNKQRVGKITKKVATQTKRKVKKANIYLEDNRITHIKKERARKKDTEKHAEFKTRESIIEFVQEICTSYNRISKATDKYKKNKASEENKEDDYKKKRFFVAIVEDNKDIPQKDKNKAVVVELRSPKTPYYVVTAYFTNDNKLKEIIWKKGENKKKKEK